MWRLDGLVNAQGALDWFAGAVAEADAVLEDLIGVVHSAGSGQAQRGTWLRRLGGMTPVVASALGCSDALAVAVSRGTQCVATGCVAVTAANADADLFLYKVQPVHAEYFTVSYHKTYKVVHNIKANENYVLYQCGTTPPAVSEFAGHKFLAVPLQAVAIEDTTVLHFLELLGMQSTIRYSQTQYTTSQCLQALEASGEVATLASTANAPLRATQLAAVSALFTSSANANPMSIAFSASADPGPLNRAEWIKFVSLFFNQEQAAEVAFTAIKGRYLCHRQAVAGVASKPVVAWMYNSSWSKNWVLSNAPFKRTLLQDAGANLIGNSTTDQTFTTAAELHAALVGVDILIDETYSADTYTWAQFLANYALTEASTLKFVAPRPGNNGRLRKVQVVGRGGVQTLPPPYLAGKGSPQKTICKANLS